MEILDSLPVELSVEEVKDRLRGIDRHLVQSLLDFAHPLISSKAVYRTCYIEKKYENTVIIDGISFTSRVLRKNLDRAGKVFPCIVTIGKGLEEKTDARTDLLEKYCLDTIGNIALIKARKLLENHLRSRFAINNLSFMTRGT